MRYVYMLLGSVCATAGLVVGCDKSSEGTAVKESESPAATTATSSSAATTTSSTEEPGVVETLPDTIPPNAFLCFPPSTGVGAATAATVADPTAPRLTISVPDGWTSAPGTDDVALTLTGPDGMSGTVTIAPTTLPPADAFKKYSDDLAAKAPLSVVNLRPAEFCGYSSQELFGSLSGVRDPIDFADRVTHIWTNTKKYLVGVHMQGPKGVAGFNAAKTALMQEFAVVIP